MTSALQKAWLLVAARIAAMESGEGYLCVAIHDTGFDISADTMLAMFARVDEDLHGRAVAYFLNEPDAPTQQDRRNARVLAALMFAHEADANG